MSESVLPLDQQGQVLSAFKALEALIAAVNQSLDLDRIINEALDQIMELFRCRATHIRLIDFLTNELVVSAHRGYTPDDLAHLRKRRKCGEGLSAVSIEAGDALIIEDLDTDPRYGSRVGFARQIGCRSFIYFPLRAKGTILGDIVLHYDAPRTYSSEDIHLCLAIGNLLGAAIQNARSYGEKMEEIAQRKRVEAALRENEKEARRLAQENELIAEVGRVVSSTLDIDKVYEVFAAKVREMIPFDILTINRVNPTEYTRTTRYHSGIHLNWRHIGDVSPLNGSVTESLVHSRSGLIIKVKDAEDLRRRYPVSRYTRRAGIRSMMGIPLISNDEVIGGLLFRSLKPDAYTERDRKLAERVALQISGAIASAELFLERKQAEEALKESEAKYYDLYENAPDMYYSLDLATGTIKECNETFVRKTGYTREELIGRSIFELYDEGSAEESKLSFQQFLVTGELRDAERRVKCRNGRIMDISLNASAIRNKDGNVTHARAIWHDITERKEQEAIIRALSTTDPLTGLHNRRGFMTLAEQQLRVAERQKHGLLLLFADADDLKEINDQLGHKGGDEAIGEIAAVLREVFRKMDILARIGGDEFAVLVPGASIEYSDEIRARLQNQLALHNARPGRAYNLSLSIGIAYYDPSNPSSLDELISQADSLMYEQKRGKVR